ncbi:MAG TPA: protein phosphatase 2C domain-containing protein [Candidatus Ruania gallistercoris]|uniref:Protein phosphatase 2C domain-containing protein n=1 Tax=Candidatus Ruania gallistercoris TaxID=2838746 RepID=A0A9D2J329_9MICO|nr:protein phosphatase 2C domain-containing protein [Candidatus Ruania gallistercoris]
MAVSFRYAVHTDLGTVRTNNEDSAFASPHLLVLADGMGGHAAGEVASAVALRVFAEVDQSGEHALAEEFLRAGRLARRALFAMSDADPVLESMGTTLLVVGTDGDRVSVGHIGDSRVYALRDGSLYQLTTDHTHVQRLIDNGELTVERARTHPYRSMLLKSLDDQPAGPDLDIIDAEVQPGDRVLLCSDGLSDYLDAEAIGTALMAPEREQAAAGLIEAALLVGTRDNVTVVVADILDDGAGAEADASGSVSPGGSGTRSVAPTPSAAGPVVVGAAADGVTLSAEAAAALHASLPEVPFDSAAPMAGVGTPAEEDPAEHEPPAAGTEEPVAGDTTADGEDVTSGDGEDGTGPGEGHPAPVNQEPTAASTTAGTDDGLGPVDPDTVPVPATSGSSLPGVLAAAGVAVLVVLLYLVLG